MHFLALEIFPLILFEIFPVRRLNPGRVDRKLRQLSAKRYGNWNPPALGLETRTRFLLHVPPHRPIMRCSHSSQSADRDTSGSKSIIRTRSFRNVSPRNFLASKFLSFARARAIRKSSARASLSFSLSLVYPPQPPMQFRSNPRNARTTHVTNIEENIAARSECKCRGCDDEGPAVLSSYEFSAFFSISSWNICILERENSPFETFRSFPPRSGSLFVVALFLSLLFLLCIVGTFFFRSRCRRCVQIWGPD